MALLRDKKAYLFDTLTLAEKRKLGLTTQDRLAYIIIVAVVVVVLKI